MHLGDELSHLLGVTQELSSTKCFRSSHYWTSWGDLLWDIIMRLWEASRLVGAKPLTPSFVNHCEPPIHSLNVLLQSAYKTLLGMPSLHSPSLTDFPRCHSKADQIFDKSTQLGVPSRIMMQQGNPCLKRQCKCKYCTPRFLLNCFIIQTLKPFYITTKRFNW